MLNKLKKIFLFGFLTILLTGTFAPAHSFAEEISPRVGGGDSHFWYLDKTDYKDMDRNSLADLQERVDKSSNGLEKMKTLVSVLSAPIPDGWIVSTGLSFLNSPANDSSRNIQYLLNRQGNNFRVAYDIYKCEIPGRSYLIVNRDKSTVKP